MNAVAPTTLALRDVALSRGGQPLIAGLSVEIGPGEALWLTGSNGSGKTSLLLACAGLLELDAGEIAWSGGTARDCVAWSAFQGPERAGLTLGEELDFWQTLAGDPAKLDERLASVGLQDRGLTPVAGLSAGQRRRLALARLLGSRKSAWLLDEPLAGLDAEGQALVAQCLQDHLRAGGLALIASHRPVVIPGIKARKLVLEPAIDAAA